MYILLARPSCIILRLSFFKLRWEINDGREESKFRIKIFENNGAINRASSGHDAHLRDIIGSKRSGSSNIPVLIGLCHVSRFR